MLQILGDTLPLALGIAISPVPIIAAILMLLSPQAQRTSLGFLGGWVGGIVVSVTIFTVLSSFITPGDPDAPAPIAGVVKLVLGLALLLLAVRQWRSRPTEDAPAQLPKWMSAVDTMTTGKAAILAFALAALNPKNLLLAASSGVSIGGGGTPGVVIGAGIVFVVIAALTVAGPVIAYRVAADRLRTPLEQLRTWLVNNNATIMAVLLLVLGVSVIGKGIAAF